MGGRAAFLLVPLAVSSCLFGSIPTCPQDGRTAKRCAPPTTLLQLSGPVASKQTEVSSRKVILERIDFDGPIHLPYSEIAQIIAHFNELQFRTSSLWLDELLEIPLRGAWQNQGYFRVKLNATPQSLGGDSSEERFALTAHVDEGVQYHLGELRFSETAPQRSPMFPESELQAAVPIQPGEIFDVSVVRVGMERLTKLYNAKGYLDFTATPSTEIDDNLQRISLTFALDEQKQFRVGSIAIIGLDPTLESRVRLIVKPGEPLDIEALRNELMENKRLLPSNWSLDDAQFTQFKRNVRSGLVDVQIDARPCPPL